MPAWLDDLLLGASDAVFARLPQALPSAEQVRACRLIAHRGGRDEPSACENTYAAFDCLIGTGIFGVEFDVRWTRDLVPVVFHDPDLYRLFGERRRIMDLSRAELQLARPEIPDLHSFVRRYAGAFHLMAEVKAEGYPDPVLQNRRLAEALEPALATRRCHLLCLQPALFALFPAIPPQQTLGIARFNLGAVSREALMAGRAGIGTHYAFLRQADIDRHHAAGQAVGSGFAHSRAVLLRELRRGVDWIFTNRPLYLQGLVQELRALF